MVSIRLRHWVDLILSENLKLPEYQRLFVWDEDAVKTLMKDFDADNFIPPVTIGSFNDEHGSSNLIIDGQQRLTSILLAYLRIFPDKEKLKKSLICLIILPKTQMIVIRM